MNFKKTLANLLVAGAVAFSGIGKAKGERYLLPFDSPSGIIQDRSGLGTGFTHRLPGTGMSISPEDPNLYLNNGQLSVNSIPGVDIQPSPRYPNKMEAPGLFLPDSADKDITISALFRNVQLNSWSDQFSIYAGTSVREHVRASIHLELLWQYGPAKLRNYIFSSQNGSTGLNDFTFPDYGKTPGVKGIFSNGDDLLVTLSRKDNLWQMRWDNLTNLGISADGSSPSLSYPWLDNMDLYVGIFSASPRGPAVTNRLEYFSVDVVNDIADNPNTPEPSTLSLLAISGLASAGAYALRKRQKSFHLKQS